MRKRIIALLCAFLIILGTNTLPNMAFALGKTKASCSKSLELGQDLIVQVEPVEGQYYSYAYIRNGETNEYEWWSEGLLAYSYCVPGHCFEKPGKRRLVIYGTSADGEKTEPYITQITMTGEREEAPVIHIDKSVCAVKEAVNISFNSDGATKENHYLINATTNYVCDFSATGGNPVNGDNTVLTFYPETAGLYVFQVVLRKNGKWTNWSTETQFLVWNGVATPTDLDGLDQRSPRDLGAPHFVLDDETITDLDDPEEHQQPTQPETEQPVQPEPQQQEQPEPEIPASISLAKTKITIKDMKSQTVTAILSNPDDSIMNVESSKTEVAKAKFTGSDIFITPAKKAGKTTVTVTTAKGATAQITVKVKKGYALNEKKITLKKGKTFKIKVLSIPSTVKAKEFKSDKPAVATVDKKGVVKAVGKGKATITVTLSNKKTLKLKVTVK